MGNAKINEIDLSLYKHEIDETVKFHEVDLLGVCNNAVYFNYFEDARVRYFKDIVEQYDLKEVTEDNPFFIMAHNSCDYFRSAQLDDELKVKTKISFIKNSSLGFDHIVLKKKSDQIIARGRGVVVYLDKSTKAPAPVPNEFFEAVLNFEDKVEILKDKN